MFNPLYEVCQLPGLIFLGTDGNTDELAPVGLCDYNIQKFCVIRKLVLSLLVVAVRVSWHSVLFFMIRTPGVIAARIQLLASTHKM
jgi:hypothetical protein